jgi:hypothetical protein
MGNGAGRASRSVAEKGGLPSQLAEDQKSKVSGFRPNSLKTKRPKEQELQDHAGAVACGCISGPHSNPTWVREWGGYM